VFIAQYELNILIVNHVNIRPVVSSEATPEDNQDSVCTEFKQKIWS